VITGKQLRRRQKLNNQLSKSNIMAAKTTAEVVWRPSVEDSNAAMVAVAAKATAEGGGGVEEETTATVVVESAAVVV
jgi:hypothetical protein